MEKKARQNDKDTLLNKIKNKTNILNLKLRPNYPAQSYWKE